MIDGDAGREPPRPAGHIVNGPAALVEKRSPPFVDCSFNGDISQDTEAVHMDGGGLLARLLLVILWYEDVGEALSFDGIAQKLRTFG